jgi:hypothetical protein
VEVAGTNVKVYVDGNLVITATISAPPGWYFGLNAYQGTATFENLVITAN